MGGSTVGQYVCVVIFFVFCFYDDDCGNDDNHHDKDDDDHDNGNDKNQAALVSRGSAFVFCGGSVIRYCIVCLSLQMSHLYQCHWMYSISQQSLHRHQCTLLMKELNSTYMCYKETKIRIKYQYSICSTSSIVNFNHQRRMDPNSSPMCS